MKWILPYNYHGLISISCIKSYIYAWYFFTVLWLRLENGNLGPIMHLSITSVMAEMVNTQLNIYCGFMFTENCLIANIVKLDNVEMVTISKDPAWIIDNKMKRISDNFALTLTYTLEILLWPSNLTLKLSSKSLHTLYSKALWMGSMNQIRLSGKYIYSEKKIFVWFDMT